MDCLLVLSVYWEESVCIVNFGSYYIFLYDYGGFFLEIYKIKWLVCGVLDIVRRVKKYLEDVGISCFEEFKRGFDYGVFVLLKLVYFEVDILGIGYFVCKIMLIKKYII